MLKLDSIDADVVQALGRPCPMELGVLLREDWGFRTLRLGFGSGMGLGALGLRPIELRLKATESMYYI